jgi:hypothetical protein
LTLGTGSGDGIFGEQASLRYKNVFFETNVQFTLHGDGVVRKTRLATPPTGRMEKARLSVKVVTS